MDEKSPILVGCGLVQQREEDPRAAREPLALMIDAARAAGSDAGAPGLLRDVDRTLVPVGRWNYRDPGGLIARTVGASDAISVSALPGVSQQTLISDACTRIAEGEIETALVVGGEAGYRLLRAQITGVELEDTPSTDLADVVLKPQNEMQPDYEQRTGLGHMPVGYYAIIESALRHSLGKGVEARRDEVARRYSALSATAASNAHSWRRKQVPAETIRDAGDRNAMLAFPYTKLHNASWSVDQASALLLCSVAQARRHGVKEEKWIHPLAFAEANHMVGLTERADLYRCTGAEIAGRAALDAAGVRPDGLDFVELYSCFPVAMDVYARALGIREDRDWSFTGGMPFAGGPFNNFVLHATAQLGALLRAAPGSRGLVSTVSGVLTKQGFAIWGTEPNPDGYRFIDATVETARSARSLAVAADYAGPARIAGFTVVHDKKGPTAAVAVVDLPDGGRSIAASADSAVIERMERDEFCGVAVDLQDAAFRLR